MKTKLDKIVDVLIESGANNDKIEMYKKLYLAALEIGFKVEDFDDSILISLLDTSISF